MSQRSLDNVDICVVALQYEYMYAFLAILSLRNICCSENRNMVVHLRIKSGMVSISFCEKTDLSVRGKRQRFISQFFFVF